MLRQTLRSGRCIGERTQELDQIADGRDLRSQSPGRVSPGPCADLRCNEELVVRIDQQVHHDSIRGTNRIAPIEFREVELEDLASCFRGVTIRSHSVCMLLQGDPCAHAVLLGPVSEPQLSDCSHAQQDGDEKCKSGSERHSHFKDGRPRGDGGEGAAVRKKWLRRSASPLAFRAFGQDAHDSMCQASTCSAAERRRSASSTGGCTVGVCEIER